MSPAIAVPLGLLLILGNAFFVGAEFAVLSARRSQIEPLAEQGSRAAKTVLWAMEHVSLMLATAQLGVTVCSTSLGAIAEPAVAQLVEGPLVAVGLPAATSRVVSFAVALTVVVYLHVVVGEMIPKNLAVSSPDRAVLWFGPPLVWLSRAVDPVTRLLNGTANLVLRAVGIDPKHEVASAFTAEEVRSIVEKSQEEGLLEDPQGLLAGAMQFSDKSAADVMVPIDQLVTVGLGTTPNEVERQVARTGFSRFPVAQSSGALVGYLHVKDVLYADGVERDQPVSRSRVRAMSRVAPHHEIEEALAVMQRSGTHLTRVVDDAGETVGVVFLEDVIEELVGEVRDAMQRP